VQNNTQDDDEDAWQRFTSHYKDLLSTLAARVYPGKMSHVFSQQYQ
jgi:hypothetical protein